MNLLHITNWYPNAWNPREVPFIKEHFDALNPLVEQHLWHVQVRNEGSLFRIFAGDYSPTEHFLILDTRIKMWRLQEVLTLALLVLLRVRLGRQWWDRVNVHIAYPLLRFPRLVRWMFGRKLVLTEHWSAYRSNFGLPDGSTAKRRIERIFHAALPVVTVSRALMNDITRFARTGDFPQFIVPNVVDPGVFQRTAEPRAERRSRVFLMVASWAPIKRPLLVMAAFAKILAEFPDARLRIVGYGTQWSDMEAFVAEKRLQEAIALLGPMTKASIAEEMQNADCFVHASEYETFSVVCAEALCCGLPVMASNVGGIPEFVDGSNGILVANSESEWLDALRAFLRGTSKWDRGELARKATEQFRPDVIGSKLLEVYERC